jgi:uncharacterized protein (TIGR02302 family)
MANRAQLAPSETILPNQRRSNDSETAHHSAEAELRRPFEGPASRRLRRLVRTTRAAILFERAWRIVLPLLVVAGLFVAVSWTGVWLEVPPWARGLGVLGFATAALAGLFELRRFRFPRRKEVLARIDKASGNAARPAEAFEDRLANRSGDPTTEALWAVHRRRAEAAIAALSAQWPSPRMAERDLYALRALVPVALVATSVVAGPEKYARVAAAFDWHLDASARVGDRIDAWIDPPPYTGKAPIVLGLASAGLFAGTTQHVKLEAPVGSTIVVRGSAHRPPVETSGGLTAVGEEKAAAGARPETPAPSRDNEVRLTLERDANLSIGHTTSWLGLFDIVAIPDKPPSIRLTDVPRSNARGSLTLTYGATDDYGIVTAEAVFTDPSFENGRKSRRSLVEPPRTALALPAGSGIPEEIEAIADLSEHPWAGARAILTLVARDAGGNESKSAPIEIRLPQKPFANPLARALVEQRRNLVLAPDDKTRVMAALEALALAPETFDTKAGVYLGLAVAATRLRNAHKDDDLLDVANYLWEMASRLEDGDLSAAERDLRAAEQALREALARKAPEDEIKRLGDNLRAALESFLREFAKQEAAKQDEKDPSEVRQNRGNGRKIDPQQLLSMLDALDQSAKSGDLAEASRLLDRLQNILENLKSARTGKSDPRANEMNRALDELSQLGKDEQALRDETYRRGQEAQRRELTRRDPWRMPPGQNFGPGPFPDRDESTEDDPPPEEKGAKPRTGDSRNTEDLKSRQQALRDRLDAIDKRLRQAWQKDNSLEGAESAMREAEEALKEGPDASDEAVEAQGRALEALRQGAQNLAEAMQGNGEGDGSGEADAGDEHNGDGQGQGGRPRYGRRGGTDPLGRASGNGGFDQSGARYDPLGAPAAQRAQRVLEELRRRLGEPARPREELDYLERLLRRY